MSIVATFRKSLGDLLAPRHLDVSMWAGGTRISYNLLEISTKLRPTVLYVKVSTSVPGFWGLTKTRSIVCRHLMYGGSASSFTAAPPRAIYSPAVRCSRGSRTARSYSVMTETTKSINAQSSCRLSASRASMPSFHECPSNARRSANSAVVPDAEAHPIEWTPRPNARGRKNVGAARS